MERMPQSWAASASILTKSSSVKGILTTLQRLDRLTQTAKELSDTTGRECIPTQADVRQPASLKEAVAKTIEKFGRIDYVICGEGHYARVYEFLPEPTARFRCCWKFPGTNIWHVGKCL